MKQNHELIKIEGYELKRIEYRNQPVLSLRMIDELHQRSESTARKAFNRNKERFIENEDYFYLPYDEWNGLSGVYETYASKNKNRNSDGFSGVHLTDASKNHFPRFFLTQSGYLLLVKSFNDDLAWKVQRALIKGYFTIRNGQTIDQNRNTMRKERLFLTEKRNFDKIVQKEARRIFARKGTIEELASVPHIQQAVQEALENEKPILNPVIHLLESVLDVYNRSDSLGSYPFKKVKITHTCFQFEASSRNLFDFSTWLSKRNREVNPFSSPRKITSMLKESGIELSAFNWELVFNSKKINGTSIHQLVKVISKEKEQSNLHVISEN